MNMIQILELKEALYTATMDIIQMVIAVTFVQKVIPDQQEQVWLQLGEERINIQELDRLLVL